MVRLMFSTLLVALSLPLGAQDLRLPTVDGSIKFAVIGDSGTGGSDQRRIADGLVAYKARFPFEFVIMLGDNLYGSERPSDYVRKFEQPYKRLLGAGVKFYASLGNHDDTNQRLYEPFNMNGERYYSFKPALTGNVRFFALDSNYLDPKQVAWLDRELAASGSDWKIAFFHHPIYSSGDRHGPSLTMRELLEPLFVKHRVNVVFQGHEHFYERIKPQKGIAYFIAGSSAKLRRGDNTSELTARVFDDGHTFMLVEVAGNELYFQTISDRRATVDYGVVRKGETDRIISVSPAPAQPRR